MWPLLFSMGVNEQATLHGEGDLQREINMQSLVQLQDYHRVFKTCLSATPQMESLLRGAQDAYEERKAKVPETCRLWSSCDHLLLCGTGSEPHETCRATEIDFSGNSPSNEY